MISIKWHLTSIQTIHLNHALKMPFEKFSPFCSWPPMMTSSNGNIFCITGSLCMECCVYLHAQVSPYALNVDKKLYFIIRKCCFMMISSNENMFRVTGPLCGESPHKGLWRGALMFPLICIRINGWVNNREAGDLRRPHTHYDVIVMQCIEIPGLWSALCFGFQSQHHPRYMMISRWWL